MKDRYVWGVDGCRKGWIGIGLLGATEWKCQCFARFADLMTTAQSARQVLVDIPIGLPDEQKRRCDQAARRLLTRLRGSSVFPVPSRVALRAEDYATACDRNQAQLGVRIAKQAWNISPKIREVDAWLLAHDPQQQKVRECHPELAFWAMNQQQPMSHPKASSQGITQRLACLTQRHPAAPQIYDALRARFPRKDVAADDIVDALVLAITAQRAKSLISLPEQPQYDGEGLRMEIVYGQW